ncbi:MAG: M28 family peptidase [Planctomycetes bacterium]|nr:M28 family peptidase [Planctomycetota bacterium]
MLRVGAVVCCSVLLLAAWTVPLRGEAIVEAKARLLEDVKYLASDELEGRGVGSNGLTVAAGFVKDQFQKAGLAVDRVNGGALQKFELITGAKLTEPNSLQFLGPDNETITLKLGEDYEACSFGGTGPIDAEIVFCGYGVEDKDDGYDDFAGMDVSGKAVIIMRRTPRQADMKTAHSMARHQDLRSKMNQALAHKAAAVLFVNDPYSGRKAKENRRTELVKAYEKVAAVAEEFVGIDVANADKATEGRNSLTAAVNQMKSVRTAGESVNDDALMKFGYAGHGDTKPVPPAFHITQKLANKLLTGLKTDLTKLEAAIDEDLKPRTALVPGWKVRGTLSMEKVRSEVFNVIGVIDGEGPLADETVIIGAHYDHVGRGGQNSLAPGSTDIHNGADDNASGTVALMELARRFANDAKVKKPARRIVFIAFTGEELGLLGSARYCREPIFPLDKTVAMFNMDMVGRLKDDNKLIVYGTGTSPRWEPELKKSNGDDSFKLIFKPEGFGPSDHSSFYAKKIPVLHFFTGEHPDYHRPTDDWEKLNIEGIARVVDLIQKLVADTVETADRPAYVEVKGTAQPTRGGTRPYFGSIPEFGNEEPGYSISGAAPGSPADKGGLKGGDRIIKFGGSPIANLDDFDAALRKFKGGDEVEVIVVRDKKEVPLKVTLEAPKN